MNIKDSARALLLYLAITPTDTTSARVLYTAYLRAACALMLRPDRFLTVGQFLTRDIQVKCHGMAALARAHCEDLGYYAHTAKPHTFAWFHPKQEQIVVDCGSSVGLFTLLALQAGSRVFAFEPNPSAFAILQHNVARNGLKGANLINKGLGERKGELLLYARRRLTGTTSYRKGWADWVTQYDETEEIHTTVTTLDAELFNVPHVHWLLIDVEGFDFQVLTGAKELLKRTDYVIIEVSHCDREKVLELLHLAGFTELARGPSEVVAQYFLFLKSPSGGTRRPEDFATSI